MEQGENRFEKIPLPVNPAELSCVLLTLSLIHIYEAFQTQVDWSSTMPARNLQVYAKWAKPD